MAPPNESSVFCENCSSYNIQCCNCIIIDGEAYCESCLKEKKVNINFEEIAKLF